MSKPLILKSEFLSGITRGDIHAPKIDFIDVLNKYIADNDIQSEDIKSVNQLTNYAGRIIHVKKDWYESNNRNNIMDMRLCKYTI